MKMTAHPLHAEALVNRIKPQHVNVINMMDDKTYTNNKGDPRWNTFELLQPRRIFRQDLHIG